MANIQSAESVTVPAFDNKSSASVIFGEGVEPTITVQKT